MPRRNLTPKAMQRFEDTYRMLGVQKEAPSGKRRHKGLRVTATAALPLLRHALRGERRFPGLRREPAGVGQFFEALNGNFTSARGNKTTHGANLDTYDPQEVDVSAVAQDGSWPNWKSPRHTATERCSPFHAGRDSPCGAV